MPVEKLREYLDSHHIKYITIDHSPMYTAREVAASTLVPRREFAKAVMVRIDEKIAMAIVPASRHVDLDKLASAAGAGDISLATEEEFQKLFPGCEVGAMPPFGNLYGMDTYVDEMLKEDDDITFNAGTHTQVVRLAYDDFEKLVQPKIASFSVKE
jgi:Ala-tRNA(Pro) deacylase